VFYEHVHLKQNTSGVSTEGSGVLASWFLTIRFTYMHMIGTVD